MMTVTMRNIMVMMIMMSMLVITIMEMRMPACLNKLVSRVIYCVPGRGHFNDVH